MKTKNLRLLALIGLLIGVVALSGCIGEKSEVFCENEVYTNSEYGFSIKCLEGWIKTPPSPTMNEHVIVTMYPYEIFKKMDEAVKRGAKPDELKPDEYIITPLLVSYKSVTAKEIDDVIRKFEDAKVEFGNGTDTIVFTDERGSSTNKLININGIEAYEQTFVLFGEDYNTIEKTVIIPSPQKNGVYNIGFWAPEPVYSKYESQIDECIQSFRFTG